ncbi:S9 family peptidase [Myroides odoratimimus]|uniref:alpha/beta hydrolase family protein n=1 Tax=Myroides odoratimimus TaxID=76832 RepID=UPI002578E542|nr:prolyl oligopeptidase family serine peptidase [Myroides odoratimimus]MDM1461311.1 S9 family peptidase [Myroides odoratimimus]
MAIKKTVIQIITLLTVSLVWATPQRDSLFDFSKWQFLDNFKLSNNGRWAAIYNLSENKTKAQLNIINTTTLTKKNIKDSQIIGLIGDFIFYSKDKNIVICQNLKTNTTTHYSINSQIDLLKKANKFVFLSDTGVLHLYSTSKPIPNQLIAIDNIQKYYVSPHQDFILIVTKKNKVEVIDVNSTKVRSIEASDFNIKSVFWGDNKDIILSLENAHLVLIDYTLSKSTEIKIPLDYKLKQNTLVHPIFLNNGNLIIVVNQVLDNNTHKQFDDYLDIWNGNSKTLENKTERTKNSKTIQKGYLFNRTSKQVTPIDIPNSLKTLYTRNPNSILIYDDIKYKDYTTYVPNIELSIYDISTQSIKPIVDSLPFFNKYLSFNLDGRYLSYTKENKLYIYDSYFHLTKEIGVFKTAIEIIWNTDSLTAYLISNKEILQLDLKDFSIKQLLKTKDATTIQLLNKHSNSIAINQGDGLIPYYIDSKKGMLFKTINLKDNTNSLILIQGDKTSTLYSTTRKITQIIWNDTLNTITFSEENFNSPPKIKLIKNKKTSTIFENPMPKELYNWRKQEIIEFKDELGNDLKGILYYPKNYDSKKSYPMVVNVYESQFFKQNTFYVPSINESTGFNIPLLTSLGYFVFLPDTKINQQGPGVSALNCVENAIHIVLNKEKSIAKDKIGIIGNSYGGYLVNYIITQTNMFSTAISGVAISDIVWDYYSYNYNFPKPSYYKYENGQYGFNISLQDNPSLYIKNNPILYAQNVQTPVLLFTGLKDHNVHWENTRHFYTALKRYNKKQIALFYKNDGHAIANKDSSKDLTFRIINWFDYFLKDNKDCDWINEGL